MPIIMTPVEVAAITGATVTSLDITLAAEAIETRTGDTPDGNVDNRALSTAAVSTAWAIISGRVHAQIVDSTSTVRPTSESEGDYSYSADRRDVLAAADLFDGLPSQLLQLGTGSTWSRAVTGGVVASHPFWDDVDQQARGWVDSRNPSMMAGVYPEP